MKNNLKGFFKEMVNKMNKKIMETPISERKLNELQPKSTMSKLKGRSLQTILHYHSGKIGSFDNGACQ